MRGRLARAHRLAIPSGSRIEVIRTSGDRIQDRPLADVGGKGLFTKEIEEALLAGAIDLAVHSSKDMPTVLPPRPGAAGVSAARRPARRLHQPQGRVHCANCRAARSVGTASLRRQAMVQAAAARSRRSCRCAAMSRRGCASSTTGEADATLLALAGLESPRPAGQGDARFSTSRNFCRRSGRAPSASRSRRDDDRINTFVKAIGDADAETALTAERSFLALLDGSCRTPIGGHCRVNGDRIHFRGLIISPDGTELYDTTREGARTDAAALGADAAQELRERAGEKFFTLFAGA